MEQKTSLGVIWNGSPELFDVSLAVIHAFQYASLDTSKYDRLIDADKTVL